MTPRSVEEQKALELARAHLGKQGVKWGEPGEVKAQEEPGGYWLTYPTPEEERKVLGPRAVTVNVRTGEVKVVPRD